MGFVKALKNGFFLVLSPSSTKAFDVENLKHNQRSTQVSCTRDPPRRKR